MKANLIKYMDANGSLKRRNNEKVETNSSINKILVKDKILNVTFYTMIGSVILFGLFNI